ncbi:YhgE/Pip family protein [Trueperella sp. LYQ143]|uniref:YhgE/Pip family protein n=1 Tax=unclassified Trueperella TaxID=2630174 RepID=UPI00398300AF
MVRFAGNKIANIVIVIALALVPFMYAGILTWAYEAPLDRMDRIPAAIVNLDHEAQSSSADGTTHTFATGDELVKRLTSDETQAGFDWHITDEESARAGLKAGTYQAMLLIPEDLSAHLAAMSDPTQTQQVSSTIHLYTDDGVNYLTGTMASSVALKLQEAAASQGASKYIDSLLLSMGPLHDGFSQAAAGAGALAEGSGKLAAGANDLDTGATKLNTGAQSLASGTGELKNGSAALSSGADTLVLGVGQIADGARRLSTGAAGLDTGITQYTAGTAQLAAGLDAVNTGLTVDSTNPDGTTRPSFLTGFTQLVAQFHPGTGGASTLKDGASALATGATAADNGLTQLNTGAQQLLTGVTQASQGAHDLHSGATTLSAGAQELANKLGATDAQSLHGGLASLKELTDGLNQACSGIGKIDPVCIGISTKLAVKGMSIADLSRAIDTMSAGVSAASDAANQISAGGTQLATGSQQLASALTAGNDPAHPTIFDGVQRIVTSTQPSADGLAHPTTLKDATSALASGANTLHQGIDTAGAGADQLASALSGQIVPGIQQLRFGALTLNNNSPALISGANQIHSGAAALAAGSTTAESGSQRLAAGAQQLDSGLATAHSGAQQLAQGTSQLTDGAKVLHEGSTQVQAGSQELQHKLTEGANKIPVLGTTQAAHTAEIAAQPIDVQATRLNPVSTNGIGFSTFFMSLSLYVGAIGIFFVIPALDLRRSGHEPFWKSAARSASTACLFGIAQAAIVVLALELLLDLHAADIMGLLLISILSSLTYVAMNQACLAVFGFRGRFFSLVLMCLQLGAAAGTFASETLPKFLQVCNAILPMPYTVRGVRTLVAGGSVSLTGVVSVLLVWMLVSIVVTLFGAYRRTGLKPMPYDPALAFPGAAPEDRRSLVSQIGAQPARS